jgi:AraC-like DNA-binding protein
MSFEPSVMSPVAVDPGLWASRVRRDFFPLDLSVDRAAPFAADVQINEIPRCKIAQVRATAHIAAMSLEGCRHLSKRYIKVIWQQAGSAHLEQGGREVDLQAGTWTIYEASRSYELHMSQDTEFAVFLCETTSQDVLVTLAQRAAGRSMQIAGGAAVALATLSSMRAEGDCLTPLSRGTVVDFVTTLLSQELQFADGGNAAARRRVQEALLRDAQQFVRQHLDRHELSPDMIASALHVSRRTLYHAFELAGETPQALVQRLRLERCRDVLSHAGSDGASITQLALEFGFADPAYFTRVFRQRFGQTPSQFRAAAQASPVLPN